LGVSLLAPLLAAAALAVVTQARAEPVAESARCSPSAGPSAPRLLTPCDHAVVRAGSTVTFVVHDTDSFARRFHPYVIVAKSRKLLNGELASAGGDGLFTKMAPDPGHKGRFIHSTKKDVLVDFPGYWLTTPGTYYVEIAQVDDNAQPYGDRYSPIEKLTVR
jgi:hypothetical protein